MQWRPHSTGCWTTPSCACGLGAPRASAPSLNSESVKWPRERSSSIAACFLRIIATGFAVTRRRFRAIIARLIKMGTRHSAIRRQELNAGTKPNEIFEDCFAVHAGDADDCDGGSGRPRAQNTVGTIAQIQGAAQIQRNGGTIAAVQNMAVMLHDKIVTEPNASLTIGLIDNSSLQLGASATLTIDESVLVNGVGAPSKVGLLGGRLRSIIVGAMRGSSTTFEVHTPNAIRAVRGTDWTENYGEQPRQGYPDCRQFT